MKSLLFTVFLIFVSFPFSVNAIRITEIAYDLEGSDSSREWVEVYNDTTDTISIDSIFLLEDDVNHKLKPTDPGETSIPPNSYAVIADRPDSFLVDNPVYIGLLFDSSFSLKNISGEELAITNKEKKVLNKVRYTSAQGARGDGNTLHISNTGDIVSGTPSPGSRYSISSRRNSPIVNTEAENKKEIIIKVTEPIFRNVINNFKAVRLDSGREILQEVRWNLGDGIGALGSNIFHGYKRNGTYIVNISDLNTGRLVAKKEVTVTDPTISLMRSDGLLVFTNTGKKSLDISGWVFASTVPSMFQFPAHSSVRAGGSVPISIKTKEDDRVEIRNSGGRLILQVNLFRRKQEVIYSQPISTTAKPKIDNPIPEKEKVSEKSQEKEIKLVLSKNNLWVWFSALVLLLIIALLPLAIESKFKK